MRKELGSIDAVLCRMDEPQSFQIVLEAMANDDCRQRKQARSALPYTQLRLYKLTRVAAEIAAQHPAPELIDV